MDKKERDAVLNPEHRRLLAHNPTKKEIESIFQSDPWVHVIITPQNTVIPRSTKVEEKLCSRPYIAGPMRGYPRFNFDAFDSARDRLKALGYFPISPADLDVNAGLDPNAPLPKEFDMRACILRDIHAICEEADCIVLLDGWEKSKGVAVEVALANFIQIPVFKLEELL